MTLPQRIGPFRLVAEIGKGGYAPVYLAVEEYGGTEVRNVALKIFYAQDLVASTGSMGAARSARDQIIEEARALCRVEHPNVVRFLQIVESPEHGVLGLAMEHLRGQTLASRIAAEGALSLDDSLAVGAAIASALSAVHAVGLVHRDVKPGNVLHTETGYKLIDFGIASKARPVAWKRATDDDALVPASEQGAGPEAHPTDPPPQDFGDETRERYTTSRVAAENGVAETAGTMGYIDPVCLAKAEPADPSSDLYALGATLYECLTGILPASAGIGESAHQLRIAVAIGSLPPRPLRSIAPHVPEAVAALVESLLVPTREGRPTNASFVASEIERLRRLAPGKARALPPEGPFRGLEPFDVRHRDLYFGRTVEIASALELLRTRGGVALVGPSGSGKSSLARAGVCPAIEDGTLSAWPKKWTTLALNPGRVPCDTLHTVLAPVLGNERLPDEPEALAGTLSRHVEKTGIGIVLFVDALEELVTMADPAHGVYLGSVIAALVARPPAGVRVVVTARRDLLDPLLGIPRLGPALARIVQLVGPLGPTAWIDALEERLAAYRFKLEDPRMKNELAAELRDTADAMPLVEFALSRLWDARDVERRVIPRAALARTGGLASALAQHAEGTLTDLVARHGIRAAHVAQALLVALTTPHGTRTRKTTAELSKEIVDPLRDQALESLEKARLIVATDGGLTIAHDALIHAWPRLRAWIDALRRDREIAGEVEDSAKRWRVRGGRDLLLRGRPLRDARAVAKAHVVPLSEDARVFLAASFRADLRNNAGVVTLVLCVFVGAALMGRAYLRNEAEAAAEKRGAMETTRTLVEAQNRPESKRAAEIAELVAGKHACEKELATKAACAPVADGGVASAPR